MGEAVAIRDAMPRDAQPAGPHAAAYANTPIRLQRSRGRAEIAFKRRGADTVLADLYQSGCSKVRLPAAHGRRDAEAVLINTAGGLTDGDHIETAVRWGADTRAVVTSQAAERVYRSRGGAAEVRTKLSVSAGAQAFWLPQETILFDGGRLERRTAVMLDETARLLASESLVLGRRAMGETVRRGAVFDGWRVRLGGTLVFADGLRLDGEIDTLLARPAVAGGRSALATVIFVGGDAADLLSGVRGLLASWSGCVGASVIGPVLLVRLLADSGAELRTGLAGLLDHLISTLGGGAGLPRVWSC